MRTTWMLAAAAGASVWFAGARLVADDAPPKKGDAATAARPTAEVGFAALRKAAADKDDATLRACLPSSLVKDWSEEATDDAKKWRADLAVRVAGGDVVSVKEDHDSAVARWKTKSPDAVWQMKLRFDGAKWIADAPWAYLVGGAELAKVNGAKPAHVKLKARTKQEYGASAFSFVYASQDATKCLNRMDFIFCRCGQAHGRSAMWSQRRVKNLDDLDGLQSGGDWMDEIVPKNGAVYVIDLKEAGRKDLQVALQITALSKESMEFDWRVVAVGKNAPASIRTPQPCTENSGADGTDSLCDAK
jgi:hypothetical protein